MLNAPPTPATDHRSDLYEVRPRPPMTENIYFLVDPDYTRVKIGYSGDVHSRIRQHWTTDQNLQIHAIIAGTRDNEREIHKFFETARSGRSVEQFHITDTVARYLDYLSDRAWAAASLDELDAVYPYPNRFPWNSDITPTGQADLFQVNPEVRKPQSRSNRILATIRSDSDEWHTPPIYIEAARRAMETIDLDPASNPLAQQTVRATNIITQREDGLRHVWRGNIWLNPPYGGLAPKFVGHLLSEYHAGRASQAVLCLNAHATDTSWFQVLWNFPLCFTHHRPKFVGGARERTFETAAPTSGIVFAYVGPKVESFRYEFSQFGPIVEATTPARISSDEFRRNLQDKSWDVAAH